MTRLYNLFVRLLEAIKALAPVEEALVLLTQGARCCPVDVCAQAGNPVFDGQDSQSAIFALDGRGNRRNLVRNEKQLGLARHNRSPLKSLFLAAIGVIRYGDKIAKSKLLCGS
jgi:hypothetical protein